MTIEFEVLGRPQGKARPRVFKKGNKTIAWTPTKTKTYENDVKNAYITSVNGKIYKEYGGMVKVAIRACFAPNKGISKKKREELLGKPCLKKPDFDNIAKMICDALNGLAYKDDNQIAWAKVEKVYANEDKVIVTIEYLKEGGE